MFFCFQIEMKIKIQEAKHQEEQLKMQQRHDVAVEKVSRYHRYQLVTVDG